MFMDKQNEFSDSQLMTTTAISTNVIDSLSGISFTNVISNLGGFAGTCFLVVQVDVTCTGGTSIAISLESDSTANLATAPVVHFSSGPILTAALIAGAQLIIVPLPYANYKRYVGIRYTIVGTYTLGSVSAFLTREPQTWKSYPVAQATNL